MSSVSPTLESVGKCVVTPFPESFSVPPDFSVSLSPGLGSEGPRVGEGLP